MDGARIVERIEHVSQTTEKQSTYTMKLLFNNLAVLLSEAELPQPNPADDYVDLPTVTLGPDWAEELSCLSACTSVVGILYKDRRVILRRAS